MSGDIHKYFQDDYYLNQNKNKNKKQKQKQNKTKQNKNQKTNKTNEKQRKTLKPFHALMTIHILQYLCIRTCTPPQQRGWSGCICRSWSRTPGPCGIASPGRCRAPRTPCPAAYVSSIRCRSHRLQGTEQSNGQNSPMLLVTNGISPPTPQLQ